MNWRILQCVVFVCYVCILFVTYVRIVCCRSFYSAADAVLGVSIFFISLYCSNNKIFLWVDRYWRTWHSRVFWVETKPTKKIVLFRSVSIVPNSRFVQTYFILWFVDFDLIPTFVQNKGKKWFVKGGKNRRTVKRMAFHLSSSYFIYGKYPNGKRFTAQRRSNRLLWLFCVFSSVVLMFN